MSYNITVNVLCEFTLYGFSLPIVVRVLVNIMFSSDAVTKSGFMVELFEALNGPEKKNIFTFTYSLNILKQ